eukprot:TRINITY_DN16973_c0_g3_i3.p1 TRINITY_DN16973_c0_g3~~TRINITY_DN16973_c0_g3_i3.p1  ORF type:complete len:404 (-),score=113.00 TRINITY_DN16973_c0_g3_i3:42-1253(-)
MLRSLVGSEMCIRDSFEGDALVIAIYMASQVVLEANEQARAAKEAKQISEELKGIHQLYNRQDADFEIVHESNRNLTQMVLALCHETQRSRHPHPQSQPAPAAPAEARSEEMLMRKVEAILQMIKRPKATVLTELQRLQLMVTAARSHNADPGTAAAEFVHFNMAQEPEEDLLCLQLLSVKSSSRIRLSVGALRERGYIGGQAASLPEHLQDKQQILKLPGMTPSIYRICQGEVRAEVTELRSRLLSSPRGVRTMQALIREFFRIGSDLSLFRKLNAELPRTTTPDVEVPTVTSSGFRDSQATLESELFEPDRPRCYSFPPDLDLSNAQCIQMVRDLSLRDLCDMGYIDCDICMYLDAKTCLLYTSDAADEEDSVDLGGRRIIKKKKNMHNRQKTQQNIHNTS